jgi:hypothetical protein
VRDRSERGQLSGSPWGVSWLTEGGPKVAVCSSSVTASTAVQWRQKVEEEEGAPRGGGGLLPFIADGGDW